MKIYFAIFILLINLACVAQSFTNVLAERPDGITVQYFNKQSEACHPSIFIGDTIPILFRCYPNNDYFRIDISKASEEIKKLKRLVTPSFIQGVKRCCERKDCGDTNNGYFLMYREGNQLEYIDLDIKFVASDKCGSDKLRQIIDLLNAIDKKYR